MFFYRRESAFRSHESKPLTPLTETAFSRGSRPSDKEGGGGGGVHPDPDISEWEGGLFQKVFSSALRASVWSKNNGREGPPGPFPRFATGIVLKLLSRMV